MLLSSDAFAGIRVRKKKAKYVFIMHDEKEMQLYFSTIAVINVLIMSSESFNLMLVEIIADEWKISNIILTKIDKRYQFLCIYCTFLFDTLTQLYIFFCYYIWRHFNGFISNSNNNCIDLYVAQHSIQILNFKM